MYKKGIKGITLIALVVTIVVLLILAAVSIQMLGGNQGIITQAQNAKLETRGGNVEEEVNLWRSENKIRKTDGQRTISKETLLEGLKNKGLLYEEEIDRENEIIRIGSREIVYGTEVIINIKKTPENEPASSVLLEVTSVKGLEEQKIQFASHEEYFNYAYSKVNEMEKSEKEELAVSLFNEVCKYEGIELEVKDFKELVEVLTEEGTEEAFYNEYGENFEERLVYVSLDLQYDIVGKYNIETKELTTYQIINPNGEIRNDILVVKNGEYTFTVEDFVSKKKYTKTVIVDNIEEDKTALKILVNSGDDGQVEMPFYSETISIEWGDGSTELGATKKVASLSSLKVSTMRGGNKHTYAKTNREYVVTIKGNLPEIYSSYSYTKEKIIEILQWGETGLQEIDLSECTNLRKIASPSENSFINITSFESAFQGCTSLIQIPQDLFANCPNVTSFAFSFWGCTGLTGETPTLWTKGTNTEENNYKGNPDGLACFWKCTGLSNYDIIPEYWKESGR